MANETMVALVATECRRAVEKAKEDGGGVPEMAAAAFPLARHHWMVLDEDAQFKGAIAAIYTEATPEDQARILAEMETLKLLAAMMSGIPVDWSAIPEDDEDAPKPFGLMGLWRETS